MPRVYGGTNVGNGGGVDAPSDVRRTAGRTRSPLTLPPLATVMLEHAA